MQKRLQKQDNPLEAASTSLAAALSDNTTLKLDAALSTNQGAAQSPTKNPAKDRASDQKPAFKELLVILFRNYLDRMGP